MQNGTIERFNSVYREAILDAYLFTDIRDSEPSPNNGLRNTTNQDPMKHYGTEHPPNGNNKFKLNLTFYICLEKGVLTLKLYYKKAGRQINKTRSAGLSCQNKVPCYVYMSSGCFDNFLSD